MKRESRSIARAAALTLAVLLAGSAASFAVTDEEVFRDFRFNLSNPGARSVGLGGAFIAVADDATASLANPAGLMLLARPEFFTEIRDTKADSSSIDQTFGGGQGIASSTDPRATFGPSFISYVYPWKRFAAGISRLELNSTNNNTSNAFALSFDPNNPSNLFVLGGRGSIQSDLSVWNVSGAAKITDKISVGATVAIGVLSLRSSVTNTLTDSSDPNSPTFNIPQTLYTTDINSTDTDFAFNAGVHWRPWSKLSFGAVYRGGMKFKVPETVANDGFFGGGFAASLGSPLSTTFNTPDSWGAGAAWRPLAALTVSLDWVHIKYSQLLDGFQSGLNVLTIFDQQAKFTINDTDEFHLGGEWVFTAGSVPWAVRGGAYSEHNARIFADFKNGQSSFSSNDSFPPRDVVAHYTVGTCVVVKDRFQIDAAADFSRFANEYVVSTIFRF